MRIGNIVQPFSCSKSHKLGIYGVGGGCAWAGKRTLDLACALDIQTEMVERRIITREYTPQIKFQNNRARAEAITVQTYLNSPGTKEQSQSPEQRRLNVWIRRRRSEVGG